MAVWVQLVPAPVKTRTEPEEEPRSSSLGTPAMTIPLIAATECPRLSWIWRSAAVSLVALIQTLPLREKTYAAPARSVPPE